CKAVRMKHRTNHQILPRAGTRTGKPTVRTIKEALLHLAGILESEESRDLIRFQRIQQLTRLPASGKSDNSNPHPACIAILRAPEHSSGHELSAGPLRLPSMPLLKLERPFAHVPSESALHRPQRKITDLKVDFALGQIGETNWHLDCLP